MTSIISTSPRRADPRPGIAFEPLKGISIVHVTTVPATLGFLQGLIGHLKSIGCDVTAVASPESSPPSMRRRPVGPWIGVPMTRSITPLADLRSVAKLWALFRRLRPRIVHAHTPKGGLLALIAASLAGVPSRVYSVHGLPMETARGWKRILLRWTERVTGFLAHRVHPVSPSLEEVVRRENLCAARKLLPPGTIGGVDAEERFSPGPETRDEGLALRRRLGIPAEVPVVGFVGRLVRDKGIHDLVEAWKRLRREFPQAHLILAGRFETRDPVSDACREFLEDDPRIHLLGSVGAMPAVYAAMDVLALPTYREGFPQTPLEAAAMEVPVVATRVTGCVDAVVDGVTGALVPPGDPSALANALRDYLEDSELRRRHGSAARRRALEDFAPRKSWSAMKAAYRERIGARFPRARSMRPWSGRRAELLIKRLLDIAGAAAGLLLLMPLLAILAAATWATLGRPLFFRQVRPGLKGKPFTPLKFRTMRPGREHDRVRMTSLGRFMRHYSLDELPQLWNVLIGEMSLVGPRPLLMAYLDRYSPRLRRRQDVRPGMTGLCQVMGRNRLSWNRKFAFDLRYVERWSLCLDARILFMTVGQVLRRRGIEGPGGHVWPGDPATREAGELQECAR